MKKRPVTVVAGGWSRERQVSLRSGKAVYEAFRRQGWKVKAVDLVAEPGLSGAKRSATPAWCRSVTPSGLLPALRRSGTKAVFLALHGPFGEDGRVQGLLEMAGIPFAGSDFRASSLAMDKVQCKATLAAAGIPVPQGVLVTKAIKAPAFKKTCVVKPSNDGSSFGVTLAKNGAAYRRGLREALKGTGRAMVEEYIRGREFTVGVVGNMALPVVEIVPGNEFYDFESKYGKAGYKHLAPAPLPAARAASMRALGLKVHRLLGCRGFSRVDMILGASGPKVIEVNTLPGMTGDSLLPDAANAAGWSFDQLVIKMLDHSLGEQ